MTINLKESGPKGTVRPFTPTLEIGDTKLTIEQRQTEALEHIAVSLSAIDNNIEVLVYRLNTLLKSTGKL
ncbi:hypothetical protein [Nitratireductor alexandrii]|uniref:hypothetical protein n=1 Tax=Nitratireductor alexandrii TaxID=2448161 RepID=UPI000FDA18F7|nr:hypothetical protein [Nitratireductor alexandrii]